MDVRQGCDVTAIDTEGGRVTGVQTSKGPIACGTVVCCAGAWSRDVAALAGVDLPVEGEKRWMWFSPEDGGLPERLPLTIDFTTTFYFHREGPGLVFGGREQTLEEVAEHAARRLPVLVELPVQSSWWGYYEVSPDWNALVGETSEPSGFFYATGFSGHGFQQAPAVGEHVAELIAGREPTLDLAAFDVTRFARGLVQVLKLSSYDRANPRGGGMTEARRESDANKAIMQRFYDEVVNAGNLDLIDELLSESFTEHEDLARAWRRPGRSPAPGRRSARRRRPPACRRRAPCPRAAARPRRAEGDDRVRVERRRARRARPRRPAGR